MGLAVGKVKLSDYDYNWPKQFEEEKANLRQIFGDSVPIEHVGSTSIEGISAKPIIDIAVGLDRLEDFENYRELFQKDPNYSIKDDSDKDEVLVRRGPEENRTHFIHISEKTSTRFNNYLKFRDYMRKHADARNKYEQLKQELAQKYADDRKSYTAAKAEFINDNYKRGIKIMYEETDLRHLDERINIEDNSQYIKKYEHIRAKLKELLGDDAVYIEHVGTTAVNDIFAYPVIDVAIAASTEKLRDRICEKLLSEHGFTECKSKNDEILIRKGTLEKPSYYIHLTLAQSNFFRTMLRFRDELKIKPKRRDAYENIHSYAKIEYRDDLDKYHNAKTSFIRATAKQNSVENYDDEIHIEKTERYRVNRSSEIVEKICGYILYAGIAQLLVRMFLGLIIVLVFTTEAVPLIIGCGLLSILSTIFMICPLIRERTNGGIVLKRIMFIVFGGVLIADAIINLIVTLNG